MNCSYRFVWHLHDFFLTVLLGGGKPRVDILRFLDRIGFFQVASVCLVFSCASFARFFCVP